ncbi:hypothetical protein EIN_059510 [Entamoeba invadens IP1]|uniref:hypothetical protein n=1 Tax=Entamoeba invadens IP1 TaxID=370355 RepID=UPI0002C3E0B6|nr:hypothetical protein EIN_059510 [Entamoeba invadens IP1]ELP93466.1 hypothetical protein EIN_059510 [Entamoeba invadens IP1]|eukprot:XP_004260237.1 hypothetical protein EIN_059510 [Entamoeba invadens IP1]
MTDLQQLHQYLIGVSNSWQNGAGIAKSTDIYLTHLQKPEFVVSLLQVVLQTQDNEPAVIQIAIVFIRQILQKYYNEENYYTPEIREQVRTLLFTAVFSKPVHARKLLLAAISIVAGTDFPTKWPTMVTLILQTFANGTPEQRFVCVQILSAVAKKYRKMENIANVIYEIKEIVKVLPVIIPVFVALPSNDRMINPILKFLEGILTIELVDEIENVIQTVCEKLADIMKTGESKSQLKILKIYRLFSTRYLDNEFLNRTMTTVMYTTSVQVLSLNVRESKNVIAAYDLLNTLAPTLKQIPNDDFVRLITIIAKDVSLTQDEALSAKEDPEEFVKFELESELMSVKKSAGSVLNLFKRVRNDTVTLVMSGIQNLMASNFDSAIRLFVGLVVEGEIARYGATKITAGVDVLQFWNVFVKPKFFAHPDISSLNFVRMFRSILPVSNAEFGEIFTKVFQTSVIPNADGEDKTCSLLAANIVENMLLLKSSDQYSKCMNGVDRSLLSAAYRMACELTSNGIRLHSQYHLRAAVRTLQQAAKINVPVDQGLNDLVTFLVKEAANEVNNKQIDGIFVGMKFEVLSVALSISLPPIEKELYAITAEACKVDNVDVLGYILQLMSLYADKVASVCGDVLAINISERTSLVNPMVKFLTACLKKSPNSFNEAMTGKLIEMFQFLLSIDFVDDAFNLLNGVTFYTNVSKMPQIITSLLNTMVQRLEAHQTRLLMYNIMCYVLQLCYVSNVDYIAALNIPVQIVQISVNNIFKLPLEMNRPVCVVGLCKLLSLPQFTPVVVGQNLVLFLKSVVDTLKEKRVIDFDLEEIVTDKTSNLSTVKMVPVSPVITNLKDEIKNAIFALFNVVFVANGQQTTLKQFLVGDAAAVFEWISKV